MDISSSPAASSPSSEVELRLEQHRRELTGHCYRMLGSAFDADDAVQETMVRAWRSFDQFEGRAAVRTWLHRIATNVCLDMLEGRARRARPMDLGPVGSAENPVLDTLPEATWILPIPDGRALAACDPAELVSSRQTIRLAFVAALQRLPPRQRAVLLLKEVLSWEAAEIAELLGMTVASVNSALQRARATLGQDEKTDLHEPMNDAQQSLLARYVEAFERQDTDALVSLLREDATWSMPPYALWLRGRASVRAWLLKVGAGCKGSRLVPTVANGSPALAQYRPSGAGAFEPWAMQVIEVSAGEIVGVCSFLDAQRLFPLFGLPLRPEP
ncbi:sigma-70 family RNA polymerase sigma factor [Sorangium sp. So ce321]|uniref:sigma-70 family RNA polymerase sigma factor n=1 Tax=Sorangium sp. So ce321 TaxID=3133300 RepID=UPI003F617CD3